jgi:hypothetical protein
VLRDAPIFVYVRFAGYRCCYPDHHGPGAERSQHVMRRRRQSVTTVLLIDIAMVGCAPGSGPDVYWSIAGDPGRVEVSLRLNEGEGYRWNEIAVTHIVVPSALAEAVGLRLPAGWEESEGPAYTQPDGTAPIPAPPGYRFFRGSLELSRSEKRRLLLLLDRPARGGGVVELRYEGHSEVCPLAGTVSVPIGTGPTLPVPQRPFPENPILQLVGLC